jgi:Tfp pilus assembly protein PilO
MSQSDTKKIRRGSWIVTVPITAVAVAYVMLFFLPGSKTIAELKKQTAEKQSYVETSAGLAAALKIANTECKKAEGYHNAWKHHAPKQRELAALFGDIHRLAKEAGTTTTRFDPEPLVQHGYLREIPLSMGCKGTLSEIFEFLRSLESMPLAVWVNSVKIGKTDASTETMDAEITLIVFAGNPEDSDYAINSD